MKQNKIIIGINGFGRIGRNLFRLLLNHPSIRVAAINDLADAPTLAHLLKYDSIHGKLEEEIKAKGASIIIQGQVVPVLNFPTPEGIPWSDHQVDLVVECSGKFKTREALQGHIKDSERKILLSVPPQDESIKMIVRGVNEHILTGEEDIISNASCTTNNAAPMIKVLDNLLGIQQAFITTVHSFTTDQSLHDQPHRDLRRARAASQSIIPTTTGAAKALTKVFPHLSEAIGGCGIRVPVPNGSLTDITMKVKRETTIEEVNAAFKEASETSLAQILQYTEDPIVSIDILGNRHSCIFDAQMTSVIGGDLVKVIGWYDNEIGYSSRLIDTISQFLR